MTPHPLTIFLVIFWGFFKHFFQALWSMATLRSTPKQEINSIRMKYKREEQENDRSKGQCIANPFDFNLSKFQSNSMIFNQFQL